MNTSRKEWAAPQSILLCLEAYWDAMGGVNAQQGAMPSFVLEGLVARMEKKRDRAIEGG